MVEQFALTASSGKFFLITTLCLIAGTAAFWYAWINLVRKRVMQDMPTAKLRSAHQGYIELQGSAELMDGAPIYSPLSRELCVWYRYKVEKKDTDNFRNSRESKWRTTSQGVSDDLFFLVDDTGKCAVDPEGAVVTTNIKRVWYGSSATAPAYEETGMLTQLVGFSQLGKNYRFTEERITPGDPLYALGNFTTHGGAGVNFDLNEAVGERLREWKKDNATMLAKFDANQDGEIDMQEWEQARRAAEVEVVQEREKQAVAPPVDLLAKSRNRRNPFILATRTEQEMLKTHHVTAVVSFFVVAPLLIGSLWAIIIRLSH